MTPGYRPFGTERVCALDPVPDGNQSVGPPVRQEEQLDGLHRPQGRLSPDSHLSWEQEVPAVCSILEGLSVQDPLFLSVDCTTGLHKGHRSSLVFPSLFGCSHYLDDWLILTLSFSEAIWARDAVLDLCLQLGIVINEAKSHLTPSQSATCLGMIIRSWIFKAFPTPDRSSALSLQVEEFLSCDEPSVVLWRSLLGHLSSLCLLVPGARLRVRSL